LRTYPARSVAAYWLREPGPNCQVIVACTGAIAPEAIQAIGLMAEDRRDVGLLAITSADRLNAGWTAAQRARERGLVHARSHIERLFADVPTNCGIVTVLDGHPATLAWIGAVSGHRVRPLGVEHFGPGLTAPMTTGRKTIALSTRLIGRRRSLAGLQCVGADNGVLRALPERHRGAAAAHRSFQLIQRISCLSL
jgi:hypothetical protein